MAGTLLLAACTSEAPPGDESRDGSATDGAAVADVVLVAGTQELSVLGVAPGALVTLLDESGDARLSIVADDVGQAHFAYVPDEYLEIDFDQMSSLPSTRGQTLQPGTYRVGVGPVDDMALTEQVHVTGVDDHPDPALYEEQELTGAKIGILGTLPEGSSLEDGFQYIETRDGTLLSAMVRFPDETLYGPGPYPTVVEIEGYSASNPDGEPPGSRVARSFGFASVAVNLRGTGCSGGVFDVFNPAQQADAYDVIETVAAQDWVKGGKVGMVGLSYSGIMQLYTAATNPPHLAAITPQSVIVDPWIQQWPGGVYNSGFTKQWLDERDRASAVGGENWVTARIEGGDDLCEDNMSLRSQNIDFEEFGHALEFRPDAPGERDLRDLVRQIDVPVFLTGATTDEQTGPLFTGMLDHFDQAPVLRVNMWNGRHIDGYSAMNIVRWFEFLALYVDESVPKLNELVRAGGPPEFASTFEVDDVVLEPDRLADQFGDDYKAAREFYEAEQPIRVIFENGAGEDEPGEPGGTFERSFDSWPASEAAPSTWFFAPSGVLAVDAPAEATVDTYRHDPSAGSEDFFGAAGYELFRPLWDINWTQFAPGDSLSYLTAPFPEDSLLGGPGEVGLWIGSEADDAAVQVTLSEVRPDGVEVLLQSAWLRVGHRRTVDERSEPLRVEHSWTEDNYEPIPAGEIVEARIAIPSIVAPIRAGSQVRVTLSSPGRDHGTWLFEDIQPAGAEPVQRIGVGGATPSSITLSFLPPGDIPAGLPPCPSLRGQPCRPYIAAAGAVVE